MGGSALRLFSFARMPDSLRPAVDFLVAFPPFWELVAAAVLYDLNQFVW